ncbi:MAG: hypothetical protein H0T76_01155 [Nannocystis sp.]|nr:hypothetical protein [Nannocystis sp.]MBA3545069.1 hypothetical protein [Nannocystis sp.]
MRKSALFVVSLSIGALAGCGSGTGKSDPAVDKKVVETKVVETKVADAKNPDAIHIDITHDKSGVLARAASTLETSDKITNATLKGHLADLSHHAEKGPSNEVLCAHMTALMADKAPPDFDCIHAIEHQRVHVGPEIFAEVAACVTGAKTFEALMLCEDAEKEAEQALHAKKHGDGLELETCTKLFVHFEKLAMADAGDQSIAVEEILEEVRGDVLEACTEQGTRAEVDCALAAKDMAALGACSSSIL